MDTPYDIPDTLVSWLDVATAAPGTVLRQSSANVHRANDRDDWLADPTITKHTWNGSGTWKRLDAATGPVEATGRLIGGCVETISSIAGTSYGNTRLLSGETSTEPIIAYVEAAEDNAFTICRNLHGMRLAGFFDRATAVMVGRTTAPDKETLTQDQAVLDALGSLGIPIIADVEIGHVPPQMTIVNGARARLAYSDGNGYLEQSLD